ncbi:MAG: hypothetical protein PHQ23_10575 [Candidatus Wallbacteria bacterium]|nr:hypothetical protein [Candidatus Wallbacteria bacterium]
MQPDKNGSITFRSDMSNIVSLGIKARVFGMETGVDQLSAFAMVD